MLQLISPLPWSWWLCCLRLRRLKQADVSSPAWWRARWSHPSVRHAENSNGHTWADVNIFYDPEFCACLCNRRMGINDGPIRPTWGFSPVKGPRVVFLYWGDRRRITDTLLRTVTFFQVVSPLLASALAEHGDHVLKLTSSSAGNQGCHVTNGPRRVMVKNFVFVWVICVCLWYY